MSTLYARVTPDFDPAAFDGVIVALLDPADASAFTENGYDTFDPEEVPRVHEVRLMANAVASLEDLHEVCRELGIRLVMSEEDKIMMFGEEAASSIGDMAADNTEANQLLELPEVRSALDARGFSAVRAPIVIENTQPDAVLVWKPGVLEFGDRLAFEHDGLDWNVAPAAQPRL